MARMKSDMMMCPPGHHDCGPRCMSMGLLTAAVAAVGLWLVVGGLMRQWSGLVPWTTVFLWYFGGFILFYLAKHFKKKCCMYHC